MQEKQQTVKLLNGEFVYGLMNEILDYCKSHDTSIKNEYTNVTPAITSKQFKYVGDCVHQPYAISQKMEYNDRSN